MCGKNDSDQALNMDQVLSVWDKGSCSIGWPQIHPPKDADYVLSWPALFGTGSGTQGSLHAGDVAVYVQGEAHTYTAELHSSHQHWSVCANIQYQPQS